MKTHREDGSSSDPSLDEQHDPEAPEALRAAVERGAAPARIAPVHRPPVDAVDATLRGLTSEQLVAIDDYIQAHLSEPVTLAELARLIGLSPSHFSRAFKRSTGVPPYRWHLVARVRRAQQLLCDPTLSVAEVALATGFSDQPHFTRVFGRLSGATPAAWRRARG